MWSVWVCVCVYSVCVHVYVCTSAYIHSILACVNARSALSCVYMYSVPAWVCKCIYTAALPLCVYSVHVCVRVCACWLPPLSCPEAVPRGGRRAPFSNSGSSLLPRCPQVPGLPGGGRGSRFSAASGPGAGSQTPVPAAPRVALARCLRPSPAPPSLHRRSPAQRDTWLGAGGVSVPGVEGRYTPSFPHVLTQHLPATPAHTVGARPCPSHRSRAPVSIV